MFSGYNSVLSGYKILNTFPNLPRNERQPTVQLELNMVSLFTIVSVALTFTASGVFGQCPPNLTGLVTNGINIGSFEGGCQWGPLTAPATAGQAWPPRYQTICLWLCTYLY